MNASVVFSRSALHICAMHDPEDDRREEFPNQERSPRADAPKRREPIFNLPGIVSALSVLLIAIHAFRVYGLDARADTALVLQFAFVPAAYVSELPDFVSPLAPYWMPFTYSLLHGSWLHLFMNLFWMAAFASPLARRFGVARFLALALLASAGGAAFHYMAYPGEFVPVIGASGAVAGFMGAAARFAFTPGARMGGGFRHDGRALGLAESFSNPQFLIFMALYLGINLLFGAGLEPVSGGEGGIAWQAHIGGFLTGIVAFSLLDPLRRAQG